MTEPAGVAPGKRTAGAEPPQPDPGGGSDPGGPPVEPGTHSPAQNRAAADAARAGADHRAEQPDCFRAVTGLPLTARNGAYAGVLGTTADSVPAAIAQNRFPAR